MRGTGASAAYAAAVLDLACDPPAPGPGDFRPAGGSLRVVMAGEREHDRHGWGRGAGSTVTRAAAGHAVACPGRDVNGCCRPGVWWVRLGCAGRAARSGRAGGVDDAEARGPGGAVSGTGHFSFAAWGSPRPPGRERLWSGRPPRRAPGAAPSKSLGSRPWPERAAVPWTWCRARRRGTAAPAGRRESRARSFRVKAMEAVKILERSRGVGGRRSTRRAWRTAQPPV